MQVFFDDQIFQKQQHGGISRYFCNLAQGLAQRGDMRVILFGGWHTNSLIQELVSCNRLKLIQKPRPPSLKINRFAKTLSRWWRRLAFLQAIQQDSETIYHPTYFQIDPFLRRHAKATVLTLYDMIAELFPQPNQVKHRQDKKTALLQADAIIAISHSTQKDLQNFYPSVTERTSVVYLTSNLGCLKPSKLPDFFLLEGSYFLILGGRRRYKNGLLALQAFGLLAQKFPNIHCVLSSQEGSLRAEEKAVLAKAGVSERVHVLFADDVLLLRLFKGAIALVYPSRYEGFGLPVLEAMQQGCPVITTRLSSLPEVAGEAAIYVNPDSAQDIATAMARLLAEPQTVKSYVSKGYAQAKKFSLTNMAAGTLAVYERALKHFEK